MSAQSNLAPIIIKRKKIIAGGHHGGAWKVAYADFVTAMMAFFLLMWLLGATTEKQRKGIADYFAPTIPINRTSGGGDGPFGGNSMMSENTLVQNGTGASRRYPAKFRAAQGAEGRNADGAGSDPTQQAFDKVSADLLARSGDSMVSPDQLRHIITRVSDEGLIIELTALEDEPLFEDGTDRPTSLMRALVGLVVRVTARVTNDIAVGGYVQARPVVLADNPVWDLSLARASRTRALMVELGARPERFRRVTGYADGKPAVRDPMAPRNNRIEVVLLRN
jgi:chemotaxis protein MotB